ncbi:hypothetical protein [Methylophaga sp.]|uniref:hypothetical protein n=1 Tax=Methylophaga sp. TaxID=2024840 RepID=UPI002728FA3F|nr:hypothetical protein [Methylophaga sp.]MDO8826201.1 hypothetical protein [Methylophaga sp.]
MEQIILFLKTQFLSETALDHKTNSAIHFSGSNFHLINNLYQVKCAFFASRSKAEYKKSDKVNLLGNMLANGQNLKGR